MKFCFATNNANKLKEIQSLLGDQFTLLTLEDIGCTQEIPEPFNTIAENAHGKSSFIWDHFQVNNFADDTGLEVVALHGDPGVRSARYAGPDRDPQQNMDLLLQNLQGQANRRARFLTIISLVLEGKFYAFEGIVEGTIVQEKRGTAGFGYDPIFVPDGYTKTFAEMSLEEKNRISHRAIAFGKLVQFLKTETHGKI